jgi:hypothetical protein
MNEVPISARETRRVSGKTAWKGPPSAGEAGCGPSSFEIWLV